MSRPHKRKRPAPSKRRRYRRIVPAIQRRPTSGVNFPSILGYVKTITSLLPVNTTIVSSILSLVDLAFNWYTTMFGAKSYTRGAYAMFMVTPAPLISESPLLAPVEVEKRQYYSFPGYPVKVLSITMRLKNTVSQSEKCGQWAAVLVPFRERHDSSHYPSVIEFIFEHMVPLIGEEERSLFDLLQDFDDGRRRHRSRSRSPCRERKRLLLRTPQNYLEEEFVSEPPPKKVPHVSLDELQGCPLTLLIQEATEVTDLGLAP